MRLIDADALKKDLTRFYDGEVVARKLIDEQQTALTADDIETIRIHLSAFKEKLCNQGRWAEAAEYERLIQRLTGKGGQDGIAEEAEKEV